MKNIIESLFVIMTLLCYSNSLYSQSNIQGNTLNVNDLDKAGLKGRIKAFEDYHWSVRDSFGIVVKEKLIDKVAKFYNLDGFIIEERLYDELEQEETRIKYKYDQKNNLTEWIRYKADGEFTYKIVFVYDIHGRLAERDMIGSVTGFSIEAIYQYNDSGKLVSEFSYNDDNKIIETLNIQYNEENLKIKTTIFDYNGNKSGFSTFDYDEFGNIVEIIACNPDSSINYAKEFDSANKIIKKSTYFNNELREYETYTYNSKGLLIDRTEFYAFGLKKTSFTWNYYYDKYDNITKVETFKNGIPESITLREYLYY